MTAAGFEALVVGEALAGVGGDAGGFGAVDAAFEEPVGEFGKV